MAKFLWLVSLLSLLPCARAQEPVAPHETNARETGDKETQDRKTQEEPIIISAARVEEILFDMPFDATVVRPLQWTPQRTMQDTLKYVPGVHIQRTSYGQSSPFLRGLTGYHTLLMVDGIRYNNSVLRSGPNEYWALVDAWSVDRMEVVMGPGSVLHGSDAVGGVVNAIPRRRESYEAGWHADMRTLVRFSTAEDSLTARAQVQGNAGENLGFVIGVTASSFGDLDAGGHLGQQAHTGNSSYYGDARFDIFLDERWSLGILAQAGRINDVGRTHRTVFGVGFHGTTPGSDQRRNTSWERDLAAIILTGEDLEGWVQRVELRLSWQRLEEDQDRVRSDMRRILQGFHVDTLGIALQLTSETAVGRLTWGIDWYHDFVDSFRDNFAADGSFTGSAVQGPVADDADYDLVGVFLQDQIVLADEWDLILSGRFTYASADADRVADPVAGGSVSIEDDWTSLIGSARILWQPTDELRFYAGVSQAFRAPNLSDLTRLDSARSNEIEIPSTGLDPEKFITLEIGGKVRHGGLQAEAVFFHTAIDDLIIRQPTGLVIGGETVVVKRNAGDGHVQGISTHVHLDIDENWWVYGSFSWTDGQIETFPTSLPAIRTESFSRLAPIQGILGAGWRSRDGSVRIRAEAIIVDAQDRLSTRDKADTQRIPPGGTPGYTIFNLHAEWSITENARLFASFENLGDKNYRTHGSGVQEPGFNAVMGVDINF